MQFHLTITPLFSHSFVLRISIAEYSIHISVCKDVFKYQYDCAIIHNLYNLSLQFLYTNYVYQFFLLVLTLHILKKLKAFDATVGILLLKSTLTNHTIHLCPFSESNRHCHLFLVSSDCVCGTASTPPPYLLGPKGQPHSICSSTSNSYNSFIYFFSRFPYLDYSVDITLVSE